MSMSKSRMAYIEAMHEYADEIGIDLTSETFSRAELRLVSMKLKGKKWIPNWITHDLSRRAGRGMFRIPEAVVASEETEAIVENILDKVMDVRAELADLELVTAE